MSSDASISQPRAAAAPAPLLEPRWQVRLLGAVVAFDGVQRIERFPSRAVAALLARVASAPVRPNARIRARNWWKCCGRASHWPWAATACARRCRH